jgi:hypothetical protein
MFDANKIGILTATIITIAAVGFGFTSLTTTADSIQDQGQEVIENIAEEIIESPVKVEKLAEKSIDNVKDIPNKIPDTLPEAIEKIKEIPPELPPIVEKTLNDEKLSVQVSIQPGAHLSACDKIINCLSPYYETIYKGGVVTWTNNDKAAHTIISGNPQEGPNGIFDSGLIAPGKTFTQVFEIEGEYEYFCVVHPWIQGKIFVENVQ